VALFDRNETTGALTFAEAYRGDLVDINGLNGSTSVAVSPDGKFAYVTGMYDGAVAVFSRNATTGALTFVEFRRDGVGGVDGLDGAYAIALSPDDNGKHVYVASYYDNALAVFSRDTTTGTLTFAEFYKDGFDGIDGLYGVNSVALSPDGEHVYTTSMYDSAVAVFSRNETTGMLTFVEMQKDGVGGVDGLGYARAVAVSPDGKHIYAVGFLDNAVAVFSRDDTAGTLTYVGVATNVDGLSGPEWVTVSPDGKHVYVACMQSKALIVFRRDETTGVLTFVEVHKDDTAAPTPGIADGLDGAKSVVVSPNGKYVYVVGQGLDQALVVFSRDEATGKLAYHEVYKDDLFGGTVDGLNTPMNVTVSPDSKHIYVASKVDDAVVVFSSNNASLEKSVSPDGMVSYGDELTYTVVISITPGTQVAFYDLLEGTTFLRFLAQPTGVEAANDVITGSLTVTPTNQITVSFVAQVNVPATALLPVAVTNRACVYEVGGTLANCAWSNEVTNPRPYIIYLPVVLLNQ
jgi:6-phosphogluconolactonase (cycloisomerase 2 family)